MFCGNNEIRVDLLAYKTPTLVANSAASPIETPIATLSLCDNPPSDGAGFREGAAGDEILEVLVWDTV